MIRPPLAVQRYSEAMIGETTIAGGQRVLPILCKSDMAASRSLLASAGDEAGSKRIRETAERIAKDAGWPVVYLFREFEQMVTQTYQALALRARVAVLEKIPAEFSNADRPLPQVEKVLTDQLSGLTEQQEQLVSLLDNLNVLQIDSSRAPVASAGKGTLEARTSFGRLARALHSTPDSLRLLTESDQTVLELAPTGQGLAVTEPGREVVTCGMLRA